MCYKFIRQIDSPSESIFLSGDSDEKMHGIRKFHSFNPPAGFFRQFTTLVPKDVASGSDKKSARQTA